MAQAGRPVDETFFCVLAPGWLDHFIFNEHYKTEEEYVFALAEALRGISAVVNAGFILRGTIPACDWWDMIKPAMSVEEYRNKFAKLFASRRSTTPERYRRTACAITCAGRYWPRACNDRFRSSTSSI